MLMNVLLCGLYYPKTAAIWAGVYTLGRLWFQIGYKMSGPKGRMAAVPIVMGTQFAMPLFTIASLIQLGLSQP